MAISITRWEMMKTNDGSYKIARYKGIKNYHNDYFDDKLNIFNEKDWQKFLVNYRGQDDARITKYNKEGILLCWSITSRGCRRDIREHFGDSNQTTAHLFPRIKNFKGENVNKLMEYNIKYIHPYIEER